MSRSTRPASWPPSVSASAAAGTPSPRPPRRRRRPSSRRRRMWGAGMLWRSRENRDHGMAWRRAQSFHDVISPLYMEAGDCRISSVNQKALTIHVTICTTLYRSPVLPSTCYGSRSITILYQLDTPNYTYRLSLNLHQ